MSKAPIRRLEPPALDPERSLNGEVSARWLGRRSLVNAAVFRTRVDDYIERVETPADPDVLTFRNLTSGALQGVELQVRVLPAEPWRLLLGADVVRGRSDDGRALADVPPHRVYAGLRHRRGRWTLEGRWTRRAAKTDPGPAEQRIRAAAALRAAVRRDLPGAWSLAPTGGNLLDEEYSLAADRKAPPAPERSLGLRLTRSAE